MVAAVLASSRLVNTSARVANEAGRRTQATTLANREIELIRVLRDGRIRFAGSQDPWAPFPAVGGGYTRTVPSSSDIYQCAAFYMEYNQNTNRLEPIEITNFQNGEPVPVRYSSASAVNPGEDPAVYQGYARAISMCEENRYDVDTNSSSGSGAVRRIEVTVEWEEPDGPTRQVVENTVLSSWGQE